MTTRSQLVEGIEPRSLEHGKRAELEAGLQGALVDAPAVPGGGAGGPPPVDSAEDPLAALLGGNLDPGGTGEPVTSGLSVGPGRMPLEAQPQDPRQIRLQQIATQAKNPTLRAMARNELRRNSGERV